MRLCYRQLGLRVEQLRNMLGWTQAKVRGLLCKQCNLIEGMLRKNGMAPIRFGERLAAHLIDSPMKNLGDRYASS